MGSKKLNQILGEYLKIIILNAILLVVLRFLETTLIIINSGVPKSLFQSEIQGLIFDLFCTNSILLLLFPLFYLGYQISEKTALRFFFILISIFTFLHFLILKYFLYQLIPLDTFVFQYSIREILFTVNTSEVSYFKSLLLLFILLSISYFSIKALDKISFRSRVGLTIGLIFSISVSGFLFVTIFNIQLNHFSKNKSLFFYSRTLSYLFQQDDGPNQFSKENYIDFQQLYPRNNYLNKEYPLLHEFKKLDVLKPYFEKFSSAPNLVILIVEG